jgi:hypothetical protein
VAGGSGFVGCKGSEALKRVLNQSVREATVFGSSSFKRISALWFSAFAVQL